MTTLSYTTRRDTTRMRRLFMTLGRLKYLSKSSTSLGASQKANLN